MASPCTNVAQTGHKRRAKSISVSEVHIPVSEVHIPVSEASVRSRGQCPIPRPVSDPAVLGVPLS